MPEPRDGALDDPAMSVGSQAPAIFVGAVDAIIPIGTGQHDAALGQPLAEGIAVVGAVADQVFRVAPPGRDTRRERGVDERDFRGRGRGDRDSQRKTLTLDQYHAL